MEEASQVFALKYEDAIAKVGATEEKARELQMDLVSY